MRYKIVIAAMILCSATLCVGQSTLEKIWKQTTAQHATNNLPEQKIIAGLKEALNASTTRAVEIGRAHV